MTKVSNELAGFSEFAKEFKKNNPETLKNWLKHGDPLHRAVATLIQGGDQN